MTNSDQNRLGRPHYRIGLDLGGTKIAGLAIADDGTVFPERRRPTPRGDYCSTVRALADLAGTIASDAPPDADITVGIAMPGSIARSTGLVQNANSTWLNARPFGRDVAETIPFPVRIANDANCLALSETHDGAGRGAFSVFAVILGTGCGGGLVMAGRLVEGKRGIAGEWGHNPLPWAGAADFPPPACWCGQGGCLETWVSGPGLAQDHLRTTGVRMSAEEIVTAAAAGCDLAQATRQRHLSRLARGLAHVVNIIDPELIVIGGGLSRIDDIYEQLPALMSPFIFSMDTSVEIKPARWGDASGVRGAGRLWPSNA